MTGTPRTPWVVIADCVTAHDSDQVQLSPCASEEFGDLCEHTFLTSQGHPYARFRRALDRGNATAALAAAADLEHVGLVDALALVLLLRDDERRFERAALRWHARDVAETRDVGMAEAQAVLSLLAALQGSRGAAAARSLAELLDRRGHEQAAELLVRWSAAPALGN